MQVLKALRSGYHSQGWPPPLQAQWHCAPSPWQLVDRDLSKRARLNVNKLTEDNFGALLPHLCHNGFARVNHSRKTEGPSSAQIGDEEPNHQPNFDIFIRTERFQDMLACNSHETKSVENRLVKTADGSEFRKDL